MSSVSQVCMEAANDHGFQRRVKYFMQKASALVLGEAFGGGGEPTITDHGLRVTYAKLVLLGSASVYGYAVAVVNNATIVTAIMASGHNDVTDSDLEYTVNSLFSDFSGYDTE